METIGPLGFVMAMLAPVCLLSGAVILSDAMPKWTSKRRLIKQGREYGMEYIEGEDLDLFRLKVTAARDKTLTR